jgi:GT2 family glycosyltransferase
MSSSVGAVIIGRNEGDRLIRCLSSLKNVTNIVYVDSGSTDNSVVEAKKFNATVISLDLATPFTAARARNEGLAKLLSDNPKVEFVQFIDGDCEVRNEWIEAALSFLSQNPDFAIVCGRRRERYPEKTIYNKLCDIEWNTPVGEAIACGGDALMRVSALEDVQGYNPSLIAGEEPEMCFRLRQLGWKIMRLDHEMTLHDAGMTSFSQWWKRHKRAGHAYAESYCLHGSSDEKFRQRENRRIIFWPLLLVISLTLSLFSPWFLIISLIYPLQVFRLTVKDVKDGLSLSDSFLLALSNVLSKFPQLAGLSVFYKNRILSKKAALIEYK